ncbi:hypothetical protein, partial [uncultured Flavonifractor sp.]|uniref:hypothetical protein n=1 Tax=uncultured Flavonifractor sp. TaxID=1193534 RepID=UPI0025D5D340
RLNGIQEVSGSIPLISTKGCVWVRTGKPWDCKVPRLFPIFSCFEICTKKYRKKSVYCSRIAYIMGHYFSPFSLGGKRTGDT